MKELEKRSYVTCTVMAVRRANKDISSLQKVLSGCPKIGWGHALRPPRADVILGSVAFVKDSSDGFVQSNSAKGLITSDSCTTAVLQGKKPGIFGKQFESKKDLQV